MKQSIVRTKFGRCLLGKCRLSIMLTIALAQIFLIRAAGMTDFRNFSGTVQGWDADTSILPVGWDWDGPEWKEIEPVRGQFNHAIIADWQNKVLNLKNGGVNQLACLGYSVSWATKDGGDKSAIKPECVPDWQAYVDTVVANLSKPPYNVRYFQIWNEASNISGGFFTGTIDEYMLNLHLPAAAVIHKYPGCKVVWGGWPNAYGTYVTDYVALLNKYAAEPYNAWKVTDVLDFHYFATNELDYVYKAAKAAGVVSPCVWQTEIGPLDASAYFLPDLYPRIFYWSVSNWAVPDQFKMFWFPWNHPSSGGYWPGSGLTDENGITVHGRSLKALNALLKGSSVKIFTDFTNSLSLKPTLTGTNGDESAIEGFTVDSNAVIAVHVAGGSATAITLTFPSGTVNASKTAKRVDVYGNQVNLSYGGGNTTLTATIADASNSSFSVKTFYVLVPLTARTTPVLPADPENKAFRFNATANAVYYTLPKSCFVSVKYYDLSGRTVFSFVNNYQQPGHYTLKMPVASLVRNIYIQEFKAGDFVKKEQVAVMK
ncbi:MAG: hypothetical protein PHC61_09030 [Chitinivibrionales bacterium]|nr:hypothetical protein [Chitinivibrionales bacterium]